MNMSAENLLTEIKNEIIDDDDVLKQIIDALSDLSLSVSELEEKLKQSGQVSFIGNHDL